MSARLSIFKILRHRLYYGPPPPFVAASLAKWYRPSTWHTWGVFFIKGFGSRAFAEAIFRGRFAEKRAHHRARCLSDRWIDRHMPPPVAVPQKRAG